MTMVSSGQISLGGTATSGGLNQSVNVELGRSGTAQITMNESAVRTLAGVPSGQISLSNFYGKANSFSFTISTNQTNANLASLATSAGWNGTSQLAATIGSGVYISSNSTGTAALTVNGSFPNGVTLTNNGYIVGMGGNGGRGTDNAFNRTTQGTAGASGGTALSVSSAITINNSSGTIAGGGGGGGGGSNGTYTECDIYGCTSYYAPGGGGGGGRSSNAANSSGGGGGDAGGLGTNGGSGGAGTVNSAGGAGSAGSYGGASGGAGGAGGGWGSGGSAGVTTGNGGPGDYANGKAGGGAGNAITGNSNITWSSTGTRLGGIS